MTRVEGNIFQHGAILLEHVPMLLLVKSSEQESPCLTRNSRHLPVAPEKDPGSPLIDRSHETQDAERSTRAARRRVRNIETDIRSGCIRHHVHPVEVLSDLADARNDETACCFLQLQQILFRTVGKGERICMQVTAMHRIGSIIRCVLVVAAPKGRAEEGAPLRAAEFAWQLERRGLRFFDARKVNEYSVIGLLHGI